MPENPPYLQITTHYRDRILAGELKDGDRLPSVRQLCDEWGVANATAAKVLKTLAGEGLAVIAGHRQAGSVVSTRVLGQAPQDLMRAVRASGRIYPEGVTGRVTVAELVADPPGRVLGGLGLDGGPVIRRRRVTAREADGLVVSVSTSWLDGGLADSAPLLLGTDRIPEGTVGYIEAVTGARVSSGVDQVRVVSLDAETAGEFGVAAGTATVGGSNWWRDGVGNVVEFGEFCVHPEHTLTYTYDIGD